MLNVIWLFMMVIAVVVAIFTGKVSAVILAATDGAKFAFTLALSLAGIMVLWLGLMKIADAAGLLGIFTRFLRPLLRKLFPEIPAEHPAFSAMTMNIAANMLGLTNAATPFGLRAMRELNQLNKHPDVASNSMCTFVTLHSCNLQIIPTTAIALLAATGALHPTDIIMPLLLSSVCAVMAAVIVIKIFERLHWYRYPTSMPQQETI